MLKAADKVELRKLKKLYPGRCAQTLNYHVSVWLSISKGGPAGWLQHAENATSEEERAYCIRQGQACEARRSVLKRLVAYLDYHQSQRSSDANPNPKPE